MVMGRGAIPKVGEVVLHPFGRGNLSTDGVQYSAASTGADTDGYVTVETATIRLPDGVVLTEVELGLTSAIHGTNTTGNGGIVWSIGNTSTGWDTLNTEVTSTSSTDSATPEEDTVSGRIVPTGGTNFTGANPFSVKCAVQSNSTGLRIIGRTKASSYVKVLYREN